MDLCQPPGDRSTETEANRDRKMPIRESSGDWTRQIGRFARYREDEEMRLGAFRTGGRYRILGWT
jgi:hypothetical protein